MWKVRTELGIDGLCRTLSTAYDGTHAADAHSDMDVLGAPGRLRETFWASSPSRSE